MKTQDETSSSQEAAKLDKALELRLLEVIGGTFRDVLEHSHAYLNFLDALPLQSQLQAFEIILVKHGESDTPKSGKKFNVTGLSEESTDRLKPGLGSLIDGNLKYILVTRPSPAHLADFLWKIIIGLQSEEEKIFALGWILADNIIPYIQIPQGGVRMDDVAYKAFIDQQKVRLKMIDAILRWPGLQNTEKMSLVLGVIMDSTNVQEQAVLLSKVVVDLQQVAVKATLAQMQR